MTLPELLQSLSVSGFSLRLFGCTAVEITGPMDRMTDAMRDALREYKPSLLELLKPRAAGWEEPLTWAKVRDGVSLDDWLIVDKADWDLQLPAVVNVKDCPEDWQTDPQYVWIGRASKRLGRARSLLYTPFPLVDVDRYRKRLDENMAIHATAKAWLSGKILVCRCSPKPCHGDTIIQFLAAAWNLPYNERDAAEVATPNGVSDPQPLH